MSNRVIREGHVYGVRATERSTNRRVFISTGLTFKEAQGYKPTATDKRYYKYFQTALTK